MTSDDSAAEQRGPSPSAPSVAAREMAAVLLDVADALDENDLRAADALTEVRRFSRRLAEAVFARGWGELFLGLDVAPAPVDLDDDVEDALASAVFDQALDSADEDWLDDDDDNEGIPLSEGARLTYQARFDFVVSDPAALLRYVHDRLREQPLTHENASAAGFAGGTVSAPRDVMEAMGLLAYIDGLGSREYSEFGLEFAGGQEIVRPIDSALWEMSQQHQDDHYPFE